MVLSSDPDQSRTLTENMFVRGGTCTCGTKETGARPQRMHKGEFSTENKFNGIPDVDGDQIGYFSTGLTLHREIVLLYSTQWLYLVLFVAKLLQAWSITVYCLSRSNFYHKKKYPTTEKEEILLDIYWFFV